MSNISLYYLADAKKKWEDVKNILETEPQRINEKGRHFGGTLAFPAIRQGSLSILKYLADKGLNFKELNAHRESVLHCAAKYNNIEILQYLVEVQKVDVNLRDHIGRTALHCAASRGHLENVKYMLAAGASIDSKDVDRKTAAVLANQLGKQEVYEYLVAVEKQSKKAAATTTSGSSTSTTATTRINHVEAQSNQKQNVLPTAQLKQASVASKIQNKQDISVSKTKYESELQQMESKAKQLELQLQQVLAVVPSQQLKIVKVLGKGATAEVSLVTWQSKQYAYKCFHDEETASMSLKEASVAMSLACPYIVHIYGKTEKPAGMLVEYMNKGSLFTVLFKTKLSLSMTQKKEITLAVGNAVELMHSRGILHRDIKPDNVLIHGSEDNSELYAKVADFGTAKSLSTRMTSATMGATITGTLNFMAPELLNSAMALIQAEIMGETSTSPPVAATKECDIYSFGVLLYELICEKQAYQGMFFPSPIQFMKHVVSGKRPEIPNNCPARWKALIEKCWHQDPNQRPSMKVVLGALERM